MLREEGYKPRILAVDEFAIHKGHSYATCVMDLEQGDILWVGKGRVMKDFEKFFEDMPSNSLSAVIGWTKWFQDLFIKANRSCHNRKQGCDLR